MIEFAKKYGFNTFSQNGEDGIIAECLKRLKIASGVAVEFGAADGFFCSNTQNLKGWKKHMYDLVSNRDVQAREITPANVNELPACDLLSIDIDGEDYRVWKAYNEKPALVIIEINSSRAPSESFICDQGTSYKPMVELGIEKGYFLLCHTGNLIFIDIKYRGLFPEVKGDGLSNADEYFNRAWL